jgi:hypothetical protein
MPLTLEYVNNSIELTDLSAEQKSVVRNLWRTVREDYTDWVADVKDQKLPNGNTIVESFMWRGMSTWWLNRLVQKSSFHTNDWLNRLMVLYLCREFGDVATIKTDDVIILRAIRRNQIQINVVDLNASYEGIYRQFKKLVLNIGRLFLSFVRQLERRYVLTSRIDDEFVDQPNAKPLIWYKTLFPINWPSINSAQPSDRLFGNTPYLDVDYNYRSAYICYVSRSNKNIRYSFLKLRRDIEAFCTKAGRPVVFPEATLSFGDICSAYVSTGLEQLTFHRLRKQEYFKAMFVLNGIDVSDVLFDEWMMSYWGMQQYAKLQGLATAKFFECHDDGQFLVTYNEFFTQNRAGYFLTKAVKPNTCFVSIQHAMNARNKMFTYYRHSEFCYDDSEQAQKYSAYPDYYLAQGNQYKKILEEFYEPERISVIGSLKKMESGKADPDNEEFAQLKKDKESGIKFILIAPSTGDEFKSLLAAFERWENPEQWHLLLSVHPTQDINKIIKYQQTRFSNLNIHYVQQVNTYDLFPLCDLVVTGFSTIAIEAFVCNVPSVRVVPLGVLPQFDDDERIPFFSDSDEFVAWFKHFSKTSRSISSEDADDVLYEYFYKNDGKAGNRLWNFVDDIVSGKASV